MIKWRVLNAVAKKPVDVTPQIAKRAYELYEQRGRQDGRAVQDWEQAEREIRKDEPHKVRQTRTTRRALPKGTKMKINSKDFRVRPGEKVKLREWPTTVKPFCKSKKQYQELLGEHVEELSSLQQLHYASNRYALLLIFQGMDAAGKDGAIRHVMSGVNPQGCEVFSFKQPSAEELEHDFLWRTTCRLPERGRIGIFNRSYYEEVLDRSGASGDSPQPGASGRVARREDHLEGAVSLHRGLGGASPP